MGERVFLIALLVVMGMGWGATMPLAKIAVSEGYRQFGLIFWQVVISSLLLGSILALRGQRLVFGRAQVRMYLFVALVGTVLPNAVSYQAAVYLPAGVIAILMSSVPMFAFPIALLMANDRFSWIRLGGLVCGLAGVVLLIGPEASLPERAMIMFVPLALVAPAFYGFEANVVAKYGMAGLNPIQLLCGASVMAVLIVLPLAVLSGQWINPWPPYGAPDAAIVTSSVIHAAVYSVYVWLVMRAGAVFAAQVSYLVTGFGILWSIWLLAEQYSGWVWAALALMFTGLFLVQPRSAQAGLAVVAGHEARQDRRRTP
ncbi:MAG: DMT family transporter [Rhodobacter sp.]|nr:DMT family transporter [Rhodobacter sp.]